MRVVVGRGLLWVGVVCVLTVGCASSASGPSLATLEDDLVSRGIDPEAFVHPMALSEEMKRWVRDHVPSSLAEKDRLFRLMEALTTRRGLAVRYQRDVTGTAREVFESGEANCLSFTNLFIALAREVDVEAYFLNVRNDPRYELEGDLVVRWEHVTAGWGSGTDKTVLEFGFIPGDERYMASRRLGDLTAIAMFYSNRGAEAILQGDLDEAVDWLEMAVLLDPDWSHSWLNLGVARRRMGDFREAEVAYRRGIEANQNHLQLYSNLATLLRLQGELEPADELLRLLDRRDNRNPFIYLSLGDTALREKRLDEAGRFYRRALQLNRDNADLKAAMGLWELASEHPDRARVWLQRAERLDATAERVERLRARLSESEKQG